jgi:hypothetical protein
MPPGGIPTHDPSKRAAVDPRLRPRGHWDRRIRTLDRPARSLVTTLASGHLYTELLYNCKTSETPSMVRGKMAPINAVRAVDSGQCWGSCKHGYERSFYIKSWESEVLTAVLQKIEVVCSVTLCLG